MDDKDIIKLFNERNETAISNLSQKYGTYFMSVAEKIVCNHEDSKICVNDAYLKTWESIPPAKPNILRAFVGKLVKNSAINMLRMGTAKKRGGGEFEGILVTDTDGSTVINETSKGYGHKTFLEIDGRLYHDMSDSIFKWYCDPKTAHVISKTDKTTRFSYHSTSVDWDESTGIIVYEDGGWKLDFFGAGNGVGFIPELPTEFTEEDNELNDILNELSAVESLCGLFYNGAFTGQYVRFKSSNNPDGYELEYSLLPKDEWYPQTCKEIEEILLKYFTEEIAADFMRRADKRTMTENPDRTFTVTTESGDQYLSTFLEINGQMYIRISNKGGPAMPVWGTAQVTEKTSDSIKFIIIYEMYNDFFPGKGSIKYGRGGWRLSYDLEDYGEE